MVMCKLLSADSTTLTKASSGIENYAGMTSCFLDHVRYKTLGTIVTVSSTTPLQLLHSSCLHVLYCISIMEKGGRVLKIELRFCSLRQQTPWNPQSRSQVRISPNIYCEIKRLKVTTLRLGVASIPA